MNPPYPLFSCFGVELEYMIVRSTDLSVVPWADRVLLDARGRPTSDVGRDDITWSNELIAHVIEFKTTDPVSGFDGLADRFASELSEVNRRLAIHGAQLLPTAMHPTMTPDQAVLWTHEFSEVYAAFDRIFDCRGHGWSNLQSTHLNLPFAGNGEFGRLHAAIRLVLPLLPALAASSPFVEGRPTGWADNRLAFYRRNSVRLPALCGAVIPEPVYSEESYKRVIFDPIASELAPHDPDGVLEAQFCNSRGAIARFDRGSIEIRLLDLQECPAADLAILRTVVALLQELVGEQHLALADQQAVPVAPLAALFNATVEQGEEAVIAEPVLLRAGGLPDDVPVNAGDWWRRVITRLDPCRDASGAERRALGIYLERGTLARRLEAAFRAGEPIESIFRRLAVGAPENRIFV